MKRLLDITFSGLGLLILSPLLVVVALLIRWKMGAPILFRQTRPGLHGKPFEMVKFRSMRDPVDAAGNRLTDAERLTGLGRFLRATSIDELPELWNVLRGEMSIVGPRPLLMDYLPHYTAEQMRRHDVKPGITGLAQINGRNSISWDDKFRYDLMYVDNQSLVLDIKIILKTVMKVIQREGINSGRNVPMPRFDMASAGHNVKDDTK